MDEPLTGREAAEALGVYSRLGASGARFDSSRVARAVRSRTGRRRVLGALVLALRPCIRSILPARRPRGAAPRRRVARAATGLSPGRPAGPGGGA